MRLLIIALIVLSVRLCKCEEVVYLDIKLVPRSMLKNVEGEPEQKTVTTVTVTTVIQCESG